jgi:hypothetical protein
MNRGSLIFYNENGEVLFVTGEVEGDVFPNILPKSLYCVEINFGELKGKNLLGVDIETKGLITEDIGIPLTTEQQRIAELENIILESEGLV